MFSDNRTTKRWPSFISSAPPKSDDSNDDEDQPCESPISDGWSILSTPTTRTSESSNEDGIDGRIIPTKPPIKRWTTSFWPFRTWTFTPHAFNADRPQPLNSEAGTSPPSNRTSCTFPIGPDSRIPKPSGHARSGPLNIVNSQWKPITAAEINAISTISKRRSLFIPNSTEYRALASIEFANTEPKSQQINSRRDSMVDDTSSQTSSSSTLVEEIDNSNMKSKGKTIEHDLPPLKHDILLSTLIYLPTSPVAATTCQVCEDTIKWPRDGHWRLLACGHRFHRTCFHELTWLYDTSSTTTECSVTSDRLSQAVTDNCVNCSNFRKLCRKIGLIELKARIARLEQLMIHPEWAYEVDPKTVEGFVPKGKGQASLRAFNAWYREDTARSKSYPPASPWTQNEEPVAVAVAPEAPMVLSPASTFMETKEVRIESWPPRQYFDTLGSEAKSEFSTPSPSPAPARAPSKKSLFPSPLRFGLRAARDDSPQRNASTPQPSTPIPVAPQHPETHIPASAQTAASSRTARIAAAKAQQKRDWRKSVPPGTDLAALEQVYRLNPGHEVFRRIEEIAEGGAEPETEKENSAEPGREDEKKEKGRRRMGMYRAAR